MSKQNLGWGSSASAGDHSHMEAMGHRSFWLEEGEGGKQREIQD
jgi:hypothetical protein